MKSSYFLIALLLFSTHLFSQETIILKGKILADSIEAPIHIINITAEKGTVTEQSGEFAVAVREDDLLLFSSVQFQKKEILITSEILAERYLEIELQKDLTELDEVRLHQLSGNLANDIEEIKTYDPTALGYTFTDREPLSIEERKFSALNSNPVGMIYGVISGENKMLKKAIANNKLRKLVNKAKNQLPIEFFTKTLFLTENKIDDFLYYSSRKSNFKELVNENDPLVLIELLKKNIAEYHEFIEK